MHVRAIDRPVNPFVAFLIITIIASGAALYILRVSDEMKAFEREQAVYFALMETSL